MSHQNAESADPKMILKRQGNFRESARNHLAKARDHLGLGEDFIIYAVLELRMALEAITYDNAAKYVGELTPKELESWQPPQLLDTLIKLDPMAAMGMEMQVQNDDGTWHSFGKSHRIEFKELRKLYNSLGTHLHSPSIKQVLKGRRRDFTSIQNTCNEVIKQISQVLDAPIIDLDFRIFGSFSIDCPNCGATVKRRLNALHGPSKVKEIIIECPSCVASFDVMLVRRLIIAEPQAH